MHLLNIHKTRRSAAFDDKDIYNSVFISGGLFVNQNEYNVYTIFMIILHTLKYLFLKFF